MHANFLFPMSSESPLRLLPITTAALEAELAGDGQLSELLRAEVTDEWPPADWERHVIDLLLRTFADDPSKQAFHRYVLLLRESRRPVLVGCVGGFVWPDRPREVEIGYSILPAFRRRGYATDATRQHAAWLRAQPERYELVAQTFPHLEASVRILNALGFTSDGAGRDEGTIAFRLRHA